ncbi:MAG: prenyltransferase [Azoarcus sp.]|nr:prenyltransferase [Azoarcus sp.]
MKDRPTLRDWIIATRPWSFPASSMPALVVFIYVFFLSRQDFIAVNWWFGVLSIVGAVIFQATGNLISDYSDYKWKVDREDTYGSNRLLLEKVFQPKTILYYGLSFLLAGILLGLFLFSKTGMPLLYIGITGTIAAAFYSQFKYQALGDFLIFIVYGPLIALGTFYAMTSSLDWRVVALSLPLSCITVDILHANNTRDIAHDRRANIKTFAMLIGIRASIVEYKVLIYAAYLLLFALVSIGILHWITLSVLVTLPIALKNCRIMEKASIDHPANIVDLDVKTAQLQLAFSGIFSGLIFISAWL